MTDYQKGVSDTVDKVLVDLVAKEAVRSARQGGSRYLFEFHKRMKNEQQPGFDPLAGEK